MFTEVNIDAACYVYIVKAVQSGQLKSCLPCLFHPMFTFDFSAYASAEFHI